MSNGLQPSGFVSPTVQELITQINTALLANIDTALDLSPDQPIGQIVGIMAEKLAEIWEAVATVYTQEDPDSAEGPLLDALCALTGTRRRSATYSTVTATLNVAASSTVPAGSVASVTGQPANTWVLEADVVNSTGSAANFTGTFRSSLPGPFAANAGTLTVISTPVSGWNSVTNAADAIQGIVADTDAVLRVRRQAELSAAGACTVDAIRADLLEVTGVEQAFVLENDTDSIDANGLPAHSFAAIIWDGPGLDATNNSIAQAIWNDKPTGIETFGNISGMATDSTGNARTVNFFRAAQVPIYLSYTLITDDTFPIGGDTLVKAAAAQYALDHLNLGVEVVALAFRSAALSVQGVVDVPTFTLGTSPSPVGTSNIPITTFEIATVDTANITVSP